MAIDDPLYASEQLVAAELRTSSSLSRLIPYVAQLETIIPEAILPQFAKSALAAAGLLVSNLEASRREYLMTSLSDELRRIRTNLEGLDEAHHRFIKEECVPLVLDGLQKAERTLGQQRIRRIAAILAHAFEVGPDKNAETAEEMMRIAMLLSDDDVLVLRALYEGQKAHYNAHLGRTDHESANDFWRLLDPTHRSWGDPEILALSALPVGILQGICGKLQSLGLLVQVERNNFKVSPGIQPYAILNKAVEFVEYIKNQD